MKFSVPTNALIVVADGTQASYFRNTGTSDIKLEKMPALAPAANKSHAGSLPTETSPNEKGEANFAKHVAEDLYARVHQGGVKAVVLIADPQTLGQIRPNLHKEVTQLLTGELHKTLTHSSIADIESTLNKAAA